MKNSTIIPIVPEEKKTAVQIDFDDKHLQVLGALQKYRQPTRISQDKLTKVSITTAHRKNKLLFLLFPEWAVHMPPYNLARLSAVTRAAGYETYVKDVNVESYHYLKNLNPNVDYWDTSYSWRWQGENYFKYLHTDMEPFLEKYFSLISENNINVLCVTLYYCNQALVEWFVAEAKKRYPHIKVIAGGPMAHLSFWEQGNNFDSIVSGEGEELILEVLDDIENNREVKKWYRAAENLRIDLDQLPEPYYDDWCDFKSYSFPNGVCMEFSRGCIAKCTFCQETHFWKYRNRRSEVVVAEIEKLYHDYGINVIWFLDSLVNGNIQELYQFCTLVIEKNLKIKWTGYARCDRRMDSDFFQKLKDSGCFALNFGIESGSDKVLKDMGKGIDCKTIEENLQLSRLNGIDTYTNWIIGFPTETINDFYSTLILLLRQRKCLTSVGQGMGFVEGGETIVGQNFDRFNMLHARWENGFITKDFANSKIHRHIRMKQFVALMHLVGVGENNYKDYFTVNFIQNLNNEVTYEDFDFNIHAPKINPLADSFVNEIFALMRVLYRWKGSFNFTMYFDKIKDAEAYGDMLSGDLNGSINFAIGTDGKFICRYDLRLKQKDNTWTGHYLTHAQSTSALRAKKLAKNDYDDTDPIIVEQKKQWVNDSVVPELSKIDFSFNYKGLINGRW